MPNFRLFLSAVYLATSMSGCFRYRYTEGAQNQLERFDKSLDSGNFDDICSAAVGAERFSMTLLLQGGVCMERGYKGSPPDLKRASEFYESAYLCGSYEGLESYRRINGKDPAKQSERYILGQSSYLLFKTKPAY